MQPSQLGCKAAHLPPLCTRLFVIPPSLSLCPPLSLSARMCVCLPLFGSPSLYLVAPLTCAPQHKHGPASRCTACGCATHRCTATQGALRARVIFQLLWSHVCSCSCSGRISVLAEPTPQSRALGKKGGEWVFTTHDEAPAVEVVHAVLQRYASGVYMCMCARACVCGCLPVHV